MGVRKSKIFNVIQQAGSSGGFDVAVLSSKSADWELKQDLCCSPEVELLLWETSLFALRPSTD